MNKTYFNLKKDESQISYQPYVYDKSDNYTYLGIGVVLTLSSIVVFALQNKKIEQLAYLLLFFGIVMLVFGLYRAFIEIKKTLVFDKYTDAIYQVTPLGKKKLIDISNVYSIQTLSENRSITYQLTNKQKASAKGIDISSFITKKRTQQEAFIFFEDELIPMLHNFMDLKDTPNMNTSNSTYIR